MNKVPTRNSTKHTLHTVYNQAGFTLHHLQDGELVESLTLPREHIYMLLVTAKAVLTYYREKQDNEYAGLDVQVVADKLLEDRVVPLTEGINRYQAALIMAHKQILRKLLEERIP